MFKRKLAKAGFFGHGALFIMVSPFTINSKPHLNPYGAQANTIAVHKTLRKDTSVLQVPNTKISSNTILSAPSIQLNAAATKYVKQFLKKNIEDLQAAEKRSGPYFSIIEPIFKKYDLPLELKYLAVVESQLKSSAVSHAGAKGPWQLMSTTARELGLKITRKYDERTHYYKSTMAAAKHLSSLYNEFGDWLLVIAAYNSGSGTVYNAIKKSGSRNFWKLQGFLPAETRGHVKRYIGTHCYFQEENSLTQLTKAETTAYLKKVGDFKAQQSLQLDGNTIIAVR
jgi:membrane-bound lytic murein transglycosylase D